MRLISFLIISLFFSLSAVSSVVKNDVYILMSFSEKNTNEFKNLMPFFEEMKEHFGESTRLHLETHVSAFKLSYILKEPTTKAVFWISHGGIQSSFGIPMNVIQDVYGNNVHDVLTQTHSGLEFLSVISCDSKYAVNPNLNDGRNWMSSKKISPMKGLKKSFKAYKKLQREQGQLESIAIERSQLKIKRNINDEIHYYGALRVVADGKFVGYSFMYGDEEIFDLPKGVHDVKKVQLYVDKQNIPTFFQMEGNGSVEITINNRLLKPLSIAGKVLEGRIQLYK